MSIYSDILTGSKHSFEDIEAFDTAEEAQDAIEDTLEFDSATDALTESTMQGELLGQKEAAMESLMASVGAINRRGRWNDEATVMFNACVESIYIGTNLPAPVISSFEAEGDAGKAAEEKSDGMWTKIKNTIKEWIRQFKEFVKKWWNIAFDTTTRLTNGVSKLKKYIGDSKSNSFSASFSKLPEGLERSGFGMAFRNITGLCKDMSEGSKHMVEAITNANIDKDTNKKDYQFVPAKDMFVIKSVKPAVTIEYVNKAEILKDVTDLEKTIGTVRESTKEVSGHVKRALDIIESDLKNSGTKASVDRLKFKRTALISFQKAVTASYKDFIKGLSTYYKVLVSVSRGKEIKSANPATESLRWY